MWDAFYFVSLGYLVSVRSESSWSKNRVCDLRLPKLDFEGIRSD